jgi:hypothetical protein
MAFLLGNGKEEREKKPWILGREIAYNMYCRHYTQLLKMPLGLGKVEKLVQK